MSRLSEKFKALEDEKRRFESKATTLKYQHDKLIKSAAEKDQMLE